MFGFGNQYQSRQGEVQRATVQTRKDGVARDELCSTPRWRGPCRHLPGMMGMFAQRLGRAPGGRRPLRRDRSLRHHHSNSCAHSSTSPPPLHRAMSQETTKRTADGASSKTKKNHQQLDPPSECSQASLRSFSWKTAS